MRRARYKPDLSASPLVTHHHQPRGGRMRADLIPPPVPPDAAVDEAAETLAKLSECEALHGWVATFRRDDLRHTGVWPSEFDYGSLGEIDVEVALRASRGGRGRLGVQMLDDGPCIRNVAADRDAVRAGRRRPRSGRRRNGPRSAACEDPYSGGSP